MAVVRWLPLASLLLLVMSPTTSGFNVDVTQAVKYTAGDRSWGPKPRSQFGFSIAQHIDSKTQRKILVGAPRTNTSQPGVIEGGAVYDCQTSGVGGIINCVNMPFDRDGNRKEDTGSGPLQIEEKSHQLFGAVVSSARNPDTGDSLACAPHYVYFSINHDKRAPIGNCYLHRESVYTFQNYTPALESVDAISRTRPSSREQFTKEGKSMFGFSAVMSQEENAFIVGAVGAFSWKGRLYSYGTNNPSNPDVTSTTSQELYLYSYHYMGYAVAYGKFTSSSKKDIVVSVPTSAYLEGSIRIYDSSLTYRLVILGQSMGQYMGYSLVVADFNNDGLDDIAAGCPFYSSKHTAADTGRVVLFYQKRLGVFDPKRKFVQGEQRSGERFGLAMATIGDINKDGFQDLAVGAPYGGSRGQGAVYVFHGSRMGLKETASQVIDAASVWSGLQTFGFALSGGLDMDNNGYPDITVGAYNSDTIVQLWSRPVLDIALNVSAPQQINLREESLTLPGGTKASSFEVRIHFSHKGKTSYSDIVLSIDVRMDAARAVTPRAFFLTPGGRTTTYETEVTLTGENSEGIIDVPYPAYIKPGVRDKLTPIIVEATYNISVSVGRGELAEVLDPEVPTTVRAEVNIEKNCGDDRTCIADLILTAKGMREEFPLGTSTLDIAVNILNVAEDDAFEAQVVIRLPPMVTYVRTFNIQAPVAVRCTPDDSDTDVVVMCDIGNPLPGNSEVKFMLRVDAVNFDGSSDSLPFYLNASSANPENDTTTGDNWAELNIPAIALTPISLSGISQPEQVLFDAEEDGAKPQTKKMATDQSVTHLYELRNPGPSTVETASIRIFWPSLFEDGGDLFMLKDVPKVIEGRGNCSIVSGTDHLQNSTDSTNNSRRKRNTPSYTSKFSQTTVVNMKAVCSMQAESWCSIIQCDVIGLGPNEQALVAVNARLSPLSLAKFPHMTILVTSHAMAKVESLPYEGVKHDTPVTTAHRVDTILATKGAGSTSVQIWVIGVSIAGGILLLIILVIILWKCGFFKRNKAEDQGMINSVDDVEDRSEDADKFPIDEGEAGNRNSRIDTVNRKLILQNGISLSIEEKR